MKSLGQNLRFGLRQLRRNPGFTATVIVTLALAIGANTAIFSIVNALMLRSLPYSHPERIGTIFTQIRGATATDERHHISGEQWELLRDNVPALMSAVSGIRPAGVNLEANSHVEYIHAGRISVHYFDVLTIHPVIGRNFTETEDLPNGPNVAVRTRPGNGGLKVRLRINFLFSAAIWRTAHTVSRQREHRLFPLLIKRILPRPFRVFFVPADPPLP